MGVRVFVVMVCDRYHIRLVELPTAFRRDFHVVFANSGCVDRMSGMISTTNTNRKHVRIMEWSEGQMLRVTGSYEFSASVSVQSELSLPKAPFRSLSVSHPSPGARLPSLSLRSPASNRRSSAVSSISNFRFATYAFLATILL